MHVCIFIVFSFDKLVAKKANIFIELLSSYFIIIKYILLKRSPQKPADLLGGNTAQPLSGVL